MLLESANIPVAVLLLGIVLFISAVSTGGRIVVAGGVDKSESATSGRVGVAGAVVTECCHASGSVELPAGIATERQGDQVAVFVDATVLF